MGRFPLLRTYQRLMVAASVLILGVAFIVGATAVSAASNPQSFFYEDNTFSRILLFAVPYLTGTSVAAGLLIVAEVLKLFLNIEDHLYHMRNSEKPLAELRRRMRAQEERKKLTAATRKATSELIERGKQGVKEGGKIAQKGIDSAQQEAKRIAEKRREAQQREAAAAAEVRPEPPKAAPTPVAVKAPETPKAATAVKPAAEVRPEPKVAPVMESIKPAAEVHPEPPKTVPAMETVKLDAVALPVIEEPEMETGDQIVIQPELPEREPTLEEVANSKQETLEMVRVSLEKQVMPQTGMLNSAEISYKRGLKLYQDKKYVLAIPFLDEAIKADPNYANAYGCRASCHKELGEVDAFRSDMTTYKWLVNSAKK